MSNINVGTVTLTNGLKLPSFTNSNRPSGVEGLMIYNSEKQSIQAYISGQWSDVGGGGKKLVEFKLWGAGGGSGSQQRNGTSYHTNTFYNVKEGGAGGFVTASFNIATGTSLLLSVGGGGRGGLIGGNPSDALGGYNGGGNSTYSTYDAGGGGGGYSGVFVGTKSQANALVIAPGGGGGGGGPGYPANSNDEANGGGGINNVNGVGNAGRRSYGYHVANAGGGTTSAGGVGGDSSSGSGDGAAGSALQGGNAVHYRNAWGSGGGGGGGWWGGGSGSNDGDSWSGGGGGAGSAFVRESGITTVPINSDLTPIEYVSHIFSLQTYGAWGNGSTPGYGSMRMPTGTGDANYPGSNVGYGGAFRLINQGGPSGYNGENGAIIYRIAGGSWTSVLFTGSDITITI
jgi:hypothetical protein